jgi:predicted transcriptional regulator YdeE
LTRKGGTLVGTTDQDPRRQQLHAMNVIGIATRTTNAAERDPATASIGKLWSRFYREGLGDQIPGRIEPATILGVYTDHESDAAGAYTLLIGAAVERLDVVPDGMMSIAIPVADYLIFPAPGSLPDAIVETWARIWIAFADDTDNQRGYTTDIEFYRFKPKSGQQEAEIAIALSRT